MALISLVASIEPIRRVHDDPKGGCFLSLPRIPTRRILETLKSMYPDARTALEHSNPFELLIATILSAQCTDVRVNIITARLFPKYKTPADYLELTQAEMEEEIRDCGLFRNKAKNILATCRILLEKHGGEVPRTREELEALPGVGRKTANVVLSNAFGIPALAVDTHVHRVSNRIGLAKSTSVLETERQLMRRIPRKDWTQAHHWLILHGREICQARSPRCEICPIAPDCRYAKEAARSRSRRSAKAEQGSSGQSVKVNKDDNVRSAKAKTNDDARSTSEAASGAQ